MQHTADIILWLKCSVLNNKQFTILWKRDFVCLKEPRKDHLGTHLHHNLCIYIELIYYTLPWSVSIIAHSHNIIIILYHSEMLPYAGTLANSKWEIDERTWSVEVIMTSNWQSLIISVLAVYSLDQSVLD